MEKEKEFNFKPLLYLTVYPKLRQVAIDNGYTLALHGSVTRDLDLIAIAWTKKAVTPKELVTEFLNVLKDGYIKPEDTPYEGVKPFSRLTFPIHLGRGAYIDLSVVRPNEIEFDLEIKANTGLYFLEKVMKEGTISEELKKEIDWFLKKYSYKIEEGNNQSTRISDSE